MNKKLSVLLLACSSCANADIMPLNALPAHYEIYAKLNTCHQLGYIGNDILMPLDELIQSNSYQDNLGNISKLTQDNMNYYRSLQDRQILGLQAYSNMPDQSGYRSNIKTLCDQLNSVMGSRLGIEARTIASEKLPASARPIISEGAESGEQTTPEDKPMEWENSPIGTDIISENPESFYLDKIPDGLETLDTPGLYIKSSVDSDGLYQINGLYELYKPKPAPGTDEILNHPFYGCEDMLQEVVVVTDVTSGGNRNSVLDFKVRHDDGATTTIPFNTWTGAMNQLQRNSVSSLIAQGKQLRIYFQLCGNGGGGTIRGIEQI